MCLSSSFFRELMKDREKVKTSFNEDLGPPRFVNIVGIFALMVCFVEKFMIA